MATPAQLAANKRHLEKLDDIKLRVPKGQREKIKAYAEEKGFSLNSYLIHLIEQDMGCSLSGKTNAPQS
ncbi:MAG: Arc family DNA-binding protein [Provencibacterium sp.]|jgi:predicted HicB family RNase H-like nuclease|nr:Arc family DNA-binding protein [Provencibacterium sp.]